MRLHLYFARRYLWAFGATFAAFSAAMILLGMVEEIRKAAGTGTDLAEILALTSLGVPFEIYRILPLITIIASIVLFLGLARSSELVIVRAAGRSALRSLNAPIAVALVLGVLSVAVLNPIVAATSKQYKLLSARSQGGASALSISDEGLWLRQGGPEGQTVIRAVAANGDGSQLSKVTFLGFDPKGRATFRIEAESARLVPGAWQLTGAKRWSFDAFLANPEVAAESFDDYSLASDLTADRIRDSFGTPDTVPIWALPGFVATMERAGFSARSYRVWMQMELAQPLMMVGMVLIGAGFTMRHVRFGRTGLMVMLAALSGFGIFFIRNFAQILGERGQIPVELAAWAPPVGAVLASLGLLLHLEDG
jgi:lipopolysaccharide export system permease protein